MERTQTTGSVRRRARIAATIACGGALVASLAGLAHAQTAGNREDLVTKLTGKQVRLDRETGRVRAITANEARELIDSVARATDASAVAAQSVARSSTSQMLRLGDHVGHIVVVRPNEDGSSVMRCVGSADEAVAFLTEEPLPLQ